MLKKACYIFSVLCFLFLSCCSFALESLPYVLSGQFVMEENSPDYALCGIDFTLLNKSHKEIRGMNIIFYLFDQDGEPAAECQNKISVQIEKIISPGDTAYFCMSLDSFMTSIPENNLVVDYLYIASLVYEDGSTWEDPYGFMAFK